jgi:hypothetical protein
VQSRSKQAALLGAGEASKSIRVILGIGQIHSLFQLLSRFLHLPVRHQASLEHFSKAFYHPRLTVPNRPRPPHMFSYRPHQLFQLSNLLPRDPSQEIHGQETRFPIAWVRTHPDRVQHHVRTSSGSPAQVVNIELVNIRVMTNGDGAVAHCDS